MTTLGPLSLAKRLRWLKWTVRASSHTSGARLGTQIATQDLYSPTITHATHRWGVHALAKGPHTIRFECVGKSKDSTGYFLGLDGLVARVPAYARDPSVDLRTLQKK
jgi:hypothetical protein